MSVKKRKGCTMKKSLLLSVLMAGVLGMTAPAYADETEMMPPALSEEDRPALPPHVKETDVVAVFAKPQAQPVPWLEEAKPGSARQKPPVSSEMPEQPPQTESEAMPPQAGNSEQPPEDADQEKLDTIWIYYADNTFDQYADVDGKYRLFSRGTYSIDGKFSDLGKIVINRTEKMLSEAGGELSAYESSHEYDLKTLGFDLLAEDGILAIYGDASREEFTDADGITRYLDTFWIFFEDGSFRQYAFKDQKVTLFSSGKYKFDGIADFHMPFDDHDHGTITLKWETSIDGNAMLEKICDLNSFGMDCLFERYEEEPDRIRDSAS